MTTTDLRTDRDIAAGGGLPVREAAVVAGTGAVLALLGYLLWQDATTCDNGFACLGVELVAAAFSAVVVPLAAWVLWRLCRVPRAFLLAVTATVIGHVLADTAGVLQTIVHGFDSDAPLAPAPVYLLVGAAAGVAALLLAGRGGWSRWVRVLVVAVVALTSFAVHARSEHLHLQHLEDELRSVGVTLYLPDFSDRATPSYASAWEDRVHIAYHFDPAPGGEYAFPDLTLLPATGDGCADAEAAGFYQNFPESVCQVTGDGFVADHGTSHFVGVRRGDTMLVLEGNASVFDDEAIAASLRDAPRVSPAELARL